MKQPDEEASVADQFIASTYRFDKIMGFRSGEMKAMEPVARLYRSDMKNAQRFVLDDEFVRYATEISSTITPEKLLARLQYANLPYDVTWIECNLRAKMNEIHRLHGTAVVPNVSPGIGYLLYRINDTDTVCQPVVGFSRDHEADVEAYTPLLFCYFFSTREREWPGDMKSHGCMPILADFQYSDSTMALSLHKGSLWGFGTSSGILESPHDLSNLRVPEFLERHGTMGTGRLFDPISKVMIKRHGNFTDVFVDAVMNDVAEFSGTIRWLVVVLSMLNEVPTLMRSVVPTGYQKYRFGLNKPLLDYHRVSLKLPKTNPVKYIERHFQESGRKHRAHEVRAFWRTYLGDTHCKIDEHEWEYDHENGYRLCAKCMAYGRRIHEHVRGDPSLGWVRKDYVIGKS